MVERPGNWRKSDLANSQESAAFETRAKLETTQAVLYELYTENTDTLYALVGRYFKGATFISGIGLWEGTAEYAAVIKILGTRQDLQRILDLAGDIRVTNHQSNVIVTWSAVNRFDITEASINASAL
jgi:hypothetical protein